MFRLPLLPTLAFALFAAVGAAQARPLSANAATPASADRLHPWLRQQLAASAADARVPVYFVLADRLGPEHWLPRVQRLPLAERRRVVLAELRAHAAAAQAPLLALLRAAEREGTATAIATNWLGNFVQVQATPAVVAAAAALPGVAEVWADVTPPLADVADGTAAPGPGLAPTTDIAGPAAAAASPPPPIPGDGPITTRAAVPWFYGALGQGVVIANVDGGMTTHQDLVGRRWTNPGEIPGNGLDDDQNGLVDDVHGFAFDTGTADFDDAGGHGTMTAGLLVADGSCTGIAFGQAPQAQIMTCRVLSETSHWNAIQYAVAMGADVQTSSFSYKAWFVPPPNYRMHRDVAAASLAAGLIRCNSTGNDAALCAVATSPARLPYNIAAPGCVPAPYRDPNQLGGGGLGGVIGVGAYDTAAAALDPDSPCGPFAWSFADLQQNLPGYPATAWDAQHHDDYPWRGGQDQGLLKPDVLGPARTTTTTAGPCGTIPFGGTSNATPCVAGAIAVWKSANPSLTPEDAAMLVHQTAADRGLVAGKENAFGSGLIDAERGFYRSLCVLRIDGQSAWQVEHSLQNAQATVAVDGVPGSLCAVLVGTQRGPGVVGPLLLDLGASPALVFYGVTDGNGDLVRSVDVQANTAGQQFVAQAVLWDLTFTQRLLDSNAIGITFTP